MIKDEISNLIKDAIIAAMDDGTLPELNMPDIVVEHPTKPEHGDYATGVAMKMARAAKLAPLKIAEIIKHHLESPPYISAVEIAPPGFVNLRLSKEWLTNLVGEIIQAGETFGNVDLGKGEKAQVEFVSANPTGLLPFASGRGGVLGDVLASVLEAAGYEVEREYYINDAGSRMDVFYKNVWFYYQKELGRQPATPDAPYPTAEYAAKEILREEGDKYLKLTDKEAIATIGPVGIGKIIEAIHTDLDRLKIEYNHWFSEQSLFADGSVDHTLKLLRESGHVAEKEGAVWFVSTALGQEKDNVLIRSNGVPTYFISDIAYHHNKFVTRGFSKVINIWGADHQGHIPRMKAAMTALHLNPDDLTIITVQMVMINGKKMKKAHGNVIPLRDMLNQIGADPIRYNLAARSPDTQFDFNVDLALEQSSENPVFYVQYAHARIASIFRKAKERYGIEETAFIEGDLNLLGTSSELGLIRQLLLLPEVIEDAARTYEIHRIPQYAYRLAEALQVFYERDRVLGAKDQPLPDPALSLARLRLLLAAKTVLARTLHLMGMTAPEEMIREGEIGENGEESESV
ncbi:MAG: arginine--tRNA ligase [Chloroflexota bacterium]|nr:arginine--tRNA ligase [Chloroflexota bacterium]